MFYGRKAGLHGFRVHFSGISHYLWVLTLFSSVKNVEIFGSMAREGLGHDVDVILTVNDAVWENFKNEVNKALKIAPRRGAAIRYHVARELLGEGPYSDLLYDLEYRMGVPIDVFVFPENWRERLDELQSAFPHEDPQFMRNIAKDAKNFLDLMPTLAVA